MKPKQIQRFIKNGLLGHINVYSNCIKKGFTISLPSQFPIVRK